MHKTEFAFALEAERLIRQFEGDLERVASMNTSADQTQASFKKIEQLMADKKAELWINHDKPQSQAQKRSPQSYDQPLTFLPSVDLLAAVGVAHASELEAPVVKLSQWACFVPG